MLAPRAIQRFLLKIQSLKQIVKYSNKKYLIFYPVTEIESEIIDRKDLKEEENNVEDLIIEINPPRPYMYFFTSLSF